MGLHYGEYERLVSEDEIFGYLAMVHKNRYFARRSYQKHYQSFFDIEELDNHTDMVPETPDL